MQAWKGLPPHHPGTSLFHLPFKPTLVALPAVQQMDQDGLPLFGIGVGMSMLLMLKPHPASICGPDAMGWTPLALVCPLACMSRTWHKSHILLGLALPLTVTTLAAKQYYY
jgi:hypothetical protein